MERGTEETRNMLEMEWLDHDLQLSQAWKSYKNLQRDYVAANRKFIIWDLIDGAPRVVDILKVGEIGISWAEGMTFILKSSRTPNDYTVTAKPRELVPGIFFWIPGFAAVRYTPFQYEEPGSARRLTLPIMFRTAHSRPPAAGRYISSMKDFKAAWPGIF